MAVASLQKIHPWPFSACHEQDFQRGRSLSHCHAGLSGEALASIAAVSQVTMLTRTEGEAAG